MSGFPIAVESVRELDQNPSKPYFFPFLEYSVFCAIIAEIGLCVSKKREIFFESINLLSNPRLISGVVDTLVERERGGVAACTHGHLLSTQQEDPGVLSSSSSSSGRCHAAVRG